MQKKTLSLLFCGILSAIGVLLLITGITEALKSQEDNDRLFAHMLLTIPGLLAFGSGLLCFSRKHHRSGAGFVFANFLYTVLCGFLVECVYYQFIHFGLRNGQPRLALVAAGVSAICGGVFLLFHTLYAFLYGKCKETPAQE